MERLVKITKKDSDETCIGVPVSEGPGTFRLILTWPYQHDGQIVEIPIAEIASVAEVEAGPIKKRPAEPGEEE